MKIFNLTVTFKCEVLNEEYGVVKSAKVFKRKRRAIRWCMERLSSRHEIAKITVYIDDIPEKRQISIYYREVAAMMHDCGLSGAIDFYDSMIVKLLIA